MTTNADDDDEHQKRPYSIILEMGEPAKIVSVLFLSVGAIYVNIVYGSWSKYNLYHSRISLNSTYLDVLLHQRPTFVGFSEYIHT